MSECGCELISVYNVLRALGKTTKLSVLALEFELLRIVMGFGFLGTNPAMLYKVFDNKKIRYVKTYSLNSLNKQIKNNSIGIVSCWNENFKGLHTFMVKYSSSDKGYFSYNGYNDKNKYSTLGKMLGKRIFIVGYWFPKG